jgi:HEAT repeat protein
VLVKIGPSALIPLIAMLKDDSNDIRKTASEILDKMGWQPGQDEIGACYWIVKQKWDKCVEIGLPAVRPLVQHGGNGAIGALIKIGESAVEPLITTLEGDDNDGRYTAAVALVHMGVPPEDDTLLARMVKSLILELKNYDMLWGGTGALVKIGTPAVEPLIAALADKNWHVRNGAAEILGQIGLQLEDTALRVSVAGHLITALKDSEEFVRKAAANALAKIGDTRTVEPFITALKDRDQYVRQIAVGVLGKIGDPRAVEPLIAMLQDRDGDVRNAAARALEYIGWRPGQDELGASYWISRRDWDECVKIGPAAIRPLSAALKSSGGNARGAAHALGQIGAVELLVATLTDGDSDMRKAAVDALEEIGWKPGQDESGVFFWDVKIKPLISALGNGPFVRSRQMNLSGSTNQAFLAKLTRTSSWLNAAGSLQPMRIKLPASGLFRPVTVPITITHFIQIKALG